jgi:hypothetical protein
VPRGYLPTLIVRHGGRLCRFGPFVGYYFRPARPGDLSEVRFVCFNERGFYASDMPRNARLYTGVARLGELEPIPSARPDGNARIRPVFFADAPEAWTASRPEPKEEYLHFHSLHDASGACWAGYWLRHEAVASFTYDMGGRVGPDSPLYHRTAPGPDRRFARIIEFDFGPQ